MSQAPISMRVGDTIAAYRIVTVNSSGQAAAASAGTDVIIGVTVDNATNSNQGVPVATSGIARVYCNDSIVSGGLIMTNASGQGIPAVATTAGIYVLGVNVGPKVNATGAIAEVLVNPFQLQIP